MHVTLAFPIGTPEMVFIFLLALLLFGAKKLPGLARSIGQSMGEFKRARDEFEHEIMKGEDQAHTHTSSPQETQEKEPPSEKA